MLYQVLYSSVAAKAIGAHELRELLGQARRHNFKRGISGVLIHFARTHEFVQVLEGERADVLALMEKIRADPRHVQIVVQYETAIRERSLAAWPMGFLAADAADASGRVDCATVLDEGFASIRLSGQRTIGLRLLQYIRATLPGGVTLH